MVGFEPTTFDNAFNTLPIELHGIKIQNQKCVTLCSKNSMTHNLHTLHPIVKIISAYIIAFKKFNEMHKIQYKITKNNDIKNKIKH